MESNKKISYHEFRLLVISILYFCSTGFLFHFPRYIIADGGSANDAGILLALGLIPALIFSRKVGAWNQKYGSHWILFVGGIIASGSNAAMVFIHSVGFEMYAIRILYALGHTIIFGSLFAQAALINSDPIRRAKLIGWLAIMVQLGSAIGSAIGEYAYFDGKYAFWLGCALFSGVSVFLGVFWAPRPPVNQIKAQINVKNKVVLPKEIFIMAGIGMALAALAMFLPAFIDDMVKQGRAASFGASWFVTTALVVVALVRFVGGIYAKYLLRSIVVNACHIMLIMTLIAVPWMQDKWQAVLLGVVYGVSYGWLYPAISSKAFEGISRENAGVISGWLVTAFEVGFRLSPISFGIIITTYGYTAMFISMAVLYSLIIVICTARAKFLGGTLENAA